MNENVFIIKVAGLVLLSISIIILIVWLLRPGKKERYEKYSKIPFNDSKRGK